MLSGWRESHPPPSRSGRRPTPPFDRYRAVGGEVPASVPRRVSEAAGRFRVTPGSDDARGAPMHPTTRRRGRWETRAGAAVLTAGLALSAVVAGGAPVVAAEGDFALPPLDAQDWQNQYDMASTVRTQEASATTAAAPPVRTRARRARAITSRSSASHPSSGISNTQRPRCSVCSTRRRTPGRSSRTAASRARSSRSGGSAGPTAPIAASTNGSSPAPRRSGAHRRASSDRSSTARRADRVSAPASASSRCSASCRARTAQPRTVSSSTSPPASTNHT